MFFLGKINDFAGRFSRDFVGSKTFLKCRFVFAADIEFPDPAFPERLPQDLRIAPGSSAADATLLMPNVNDDFTGKGPDMGAYEIGKPVPHYGPRPRGE